MTLVEGERVQRLRKECSPFVARVLQGPVETSLSEFESLSRLRGGRAERSTVRQRARSLCRTSPHHRAVWPGR